MLIYFVTENNGKSIKIQIDCDDILKILAGLTNQDYKVPDTPIEITKLIAQVDKNGKIIGNPYHPEDTTDATVTSSTNGKIRLPTQWEVKQEVEMDLMKADLERQMDRENHNFIVRPLSMSEDELEVVDTSNQTIKTENKKELVTEDYLQKERQKKNDVNSILNKEEIVDKKDSIIRERKKEIDAVAMENNAVHVEKDFGVEDSDVNQKRFLLKKGDISGPIQMDYSPSKTVLVKKMLENDKDDQIRIEYSPIKSGMVSDEERAKKPADNQDFKDFQRRFILVDSPKERN